MNQAAVVVGQSHIGPALYGSIVIGESSCVISEIVVGVSAIVIRERTIRSEPDRLGEIGKRAFVIALRGVGDAPVRISHGQIGTERLAGANVGRAAADLSRPVLELIAVSDGIFGLGCRQARQQEE